MNNKDYKTIKEIADIYGVSVQAVYNWAKTYDIKSKDVLGVRTLNIKDIEAVKGSANTSYNDDSPNKEARTGSILNNKNENLELVTGGSIPNDNNENLDPASGTGSILTNEDLAHQNELLKQKIEYLEELNGQLKDYNRSLEEQNGFLIYEISEYKNKIKALEAPKEEKKESFFNKFKNIFKKD